MKCLKCNTQIPSKLEIDGKIRNLQRRNYCLKCSPFNEHNTKQLHSTKSITRRRSKKDNTKCICKICDKHYIYHRMSGHSLSICNSCASKRRRLKLKLKFVEQLGGKCTECGYKELPEILNFHHIDEGKKGFTISYNYNLSEKKLNEEVKKCKLLCPTCHTKHHLTKRHFEIKKHLIMHT